MECPPADRDLTRVGAASVNGERAPCHRQDFPCMYADVRLSMVYGSVTTSKCDMYIFLAQYLLLCLFVRAGDGACDPDHNSEYCDWDGGEV